MESIKILLIIILVLLCIGFVCMYIIFIKFAKNEFAKIDNKIYYIDDKLSLILNNYSIHTNQIQELNKAIYSLYDDHIKVIENYTKYCATSIAKKHKSNKYKTNTKQQ